jgi:hypothetical protein
VASISEKDAQWEALDVVEPELRRRMAVAAKEVSA